MQMSIRPFLFEPKFVRRRTYVLAPLHYASVASRPITMDIEPKAFFHWP
jgi:hypothetical protein